MNGAAVTRRDRRAAAAIGRHARLELVFGYRRGRTVLTRAYAEPPFKIGRPVDAGGAAALILVCAAPGVFPGDELRQTVRVEVQRIDGRELPARHAPERGQLELAHRLDGPLAAGRQPGGLGQRGASQSTPPSGAR